MESNGDLKKTWQTLKQAMNREGKSSPIDKLNINGNEINDKMKIAEYFNISQRNWWKVTVI